ncbi:receptor-type protein kinase, putative [Bodo saltans]|uniref:Receptor-type protein kinase, putative n=1 Tax=Bodo saltans TaxID=75058 RepID=A0A0S4IRN7_BODSA|nr:receptor-type protein kinase, putative [Bodo saltans]|eukprot:CUG02925.1 receptor-type protein kinase, putative [Bodo saltans]
MSRSSCSSLTCSKQNDAHRADHQSSSSACCNCGHRSVFPRSRRRHALVSSLQRLNLSSSRSITNSAMNEVVLLKSITHLDLSRCFGIGDDGVCVILSSMLRLQSLALEGCYCVTFAEFEDIAPQSRLNRLNVKGCWDVLDEGLSCVSLLPQLTYLDVSDCRQITDEGIMSLASKTSSLTYLDLQGSRMAEAGFTCLAGSFPHLQHLSMSWPRSAIPDLIIARISSFHLLQHLDLFGFENLSDAAAESIATLTHLQHLNLTKCYAISDDNVATIAAALIHLTYLHLSWCRNITDAALGSIATSLLDLEELCLAECVKITDVGLDHIRSLHRLQHLNLWECFKITDAGVASISSLHELRYLKLRPCKLLTDASLVSLSGLQHLETLDVSLCKNMTWPYIAPLRKRVKFLSSNVFEPLQ